MIAHILAYAVHVLLRGRHEEKDEEKEEKKYCMSLYQYVSWHKVQEREIGMTPEKGTS